MAAMTTPDSVEARHTLSTAVARYNDLSTRNLLTSAGADLGDEAHRPPPLPAGEALELLALGEVIARKAGYGRQLAVRSARLAGASWSQIGAALGTSKQAAWESHSRWIDQQVAKRGRIGYMGMDEAQAAAARALAGEPDDEQPG
jgi:hypothetical protein